MGLPGIRLRPPALKVAADQYLAAAGDARDVELGRVEQTDQLAQDLDRAPGLAGVVAARRQAAEGAHHAGADGAQDHLAVALLDARDHAAFVTAVETAAAAARDGLMVTFGIIADRPESGYAYIRRGAALAGLDG